MESQPLLKKKGESSGKGVKKSHIGNLMFGNLILFIFILAVTIQLPVQSQYLYRRVSEDVFGNSSKVKNQPLNQTCYLNTSDPEYILQEKAQEIAAAKQMQFTIVASTITLFTTILLGAYSDSVGRKFLFAGPLIGHFIRFSVITSIIYWHLDLNYFFLGVVIDGITGGFYAIMLASYAYAADNTPPTGSRTMGIACLEVVQALGAAVSSTATGYFIQDVGFFYPMLVATLLLFFDGILVLVLLPERPELKRKEESYCFSPLEALRRVFGFYLQDGNRLKKVCFVLGMAIFIFACIPGVGGSNLDTLYKLNLPFCWSPEMIGYYSTAGAVVSQIIGVPLTRLLHCCCLDEVIAVIGSLSVAVSDITEGFANTDWIMCAAVVVNIPSATMYPVIRAILSRMAPANRQGSLFASIAVIESICTLVGTPIFSKIYQKTVVFFRGLVFISMAAFHIVSAILLIVFINVSKPERQKRQVNTLSVQEETDGEKGDLSNEEGDNTLDNEQAIAIP